MAVKKLSKSKNEECSLFIELVIDLRIPFLRLFVLIEGKPVQILILNGSHPRASQRYSSLSFPFLI